MVAIATLPRSTTGPSVGRLRLVSPDRPRTVHVDGIARLAGVAALVVVVALAVAYLVAAPPAATPGTVPVQAEAHVVTAGETMWSIASDVAPAGEAATYVERLVAVNGTAVAVPGAALALPVP